MAHMRLSQICLFEPELTPRTVAAAHHISISRLHRLFERWGFARADDSTRTFHELLAPLRDPARRAAATTPGPTPGPVTLGYVPHG